MRRELEERVREDLDKKLVLLCGPRQAGKTTLARSLTSSHVYLNFDAAADRRMILAQSWSRDADLVVFDELHKMRKWKSFVKGVFDAEGARPRIIVTGSARLDVYRKGGDSLAGRFFLHRLHPFTVREVAPEVEPAEALERLLTVGGFPEPFIDAKPDFARRWRRTHLDTILREDLLDLERVRDVRSIEVLVDLLRARVGATTSYTSLANDLHVSVHTVKHWLQILENLYVIFAVRPFHRNIARSLLKESKYYFYDTGAVADAVDNPGAVLENVVACALLRELQLDEDASGRRNSLHFIRDKEKREVDFLTVVGGKPRQLIEVKWSDDAVSPALRYFHKRLAGTEAVQLVHRGSREYGAPGVRVSATARFLAAVDYRGS